MVHLNMLWDMKFSHISGLSLNPKVYFNLKGSKGHSLIAILGLIGKIPFEKEDFRPKVTNMLWT